MGRVEQIWLKRFHRGPMDAVTQATLRASQGVVNSADQGSHRQVTLIARGRWDRVMESLATDVDPSLRRVNILVDGVDLENSRGRILRVGSCRLRIRGETRPCERMDEALPGLRAALSPHWGGGAYAEILNDGEIRVGEEVQWDA